MLDRSLSIVLVHKTVVKWQIHFDMEAKGCYPLALPRRVREPDLRRRAVGKPLPGIRAGQGSSAFDATEGVILDVPRSVLIVDPSEESREVLQTALERRGLRTFSAGEARRGLDLARRHHPDLIVLDLELDDCGTDQFGENNTPLVLLGSLRRGDPLTAGEFVPKPYHYAPLIRKIEELLEASSTGP
jgi:CheY-like chemotaxis protein